MKDWQKSKLHYGERIKIPDTVFVQDGKRCTDAYYIGETDSGIILQVNFMPGWDTQEPTWNYKYFVNWASIWCGHIKLFSKESGEEIRAKRLNDPLLAFMRD